MPKLVIRSETGEQIPHDLVDGVTTIGRSPDNGIFLEEISVSGHHAELTLTGENCSLKDLDSTNGTLVNGHPVTEVQLRPGDRIKFGKVEACYECEAAGAAQPLPQLEEVQTHPAEMSARPADFANASPFAGARKENDPTRKWFFVAAAAAFLAFLGSMIAVFLLRAPAI